MQRSEGQAESRLWKSSSRSAKSTREKARRLLKNSSKSAGSIREKPNSKNFQAQQEAPKRKPTSEKLFKVSKKCQGTTLQAAEKVVHQKVLYQGASLLAPQAEQNEYRALAPAPFSSAKTIFSAASLVVPKPLQNQRGLQALRDVLLEIRPLISIFDLHFSASCLVVPKPFQN